MTQNKVEKINKEKIATEGRETTNNIKTCKKIYGKNLDMPNRKEEEKTGPGKTVCWVTFRANITRIEQKWRL